MFINIFLFFYLNKINLNIYIYIFMIKKKKNFIQIFKENESFSFLKKMCIVFFIFGHPKYKL